FTHVHLTPKFPPALLNTALATYLSLQEDELLLAIIDRGGQKAKGGCALTTRRIYWTDRDGAGAPPREPGSKRLRRPSPNRFGVRVAGYADLPDHIEAGASPTGSFGIDFAGGTRLDLGQVDRGLAPALARFLETIGRAARAGAPPSGLIDPDL